MENLGKTSSLNDVTESGSHVTASPKKQNKILVTINNFINQKIAPVFIDSKIRKYMNYANRSQKVSPEIAEKHLKYKELRDKKSSEGLNSQEIADFEKLKIELEAIKQARAEERSVKKKAGYFGQNSLDALESNCHYAKRCLDKANWTPAERQEIEKILRHREILREMEYAKTAGRTSVVHTIRRRIESLSDKGSKAVVQTDRGASFSIPGGCKDHYVTYEFRKEGEDYFFVIHNRGSRGKNTTLHGDLSFQHQGMPYEKTSVKIKTTKEALANPQFIESLLKSEQSSSMERAYQVIEDHFLKTIPGGQPLGVLVKSEVELLIESKKAELLKEKQKAEELLQKLKAELAVEDKNSGHSLTNRKAELVKEIQRAEQELERAKIYRPTNEEIHMLLEDPSFHSRQVYGTCTESNLTGPEKELASSLTRKRIKYFTIETLVQEISSKNFVLRMNQRYQAAILHHSEARLDELRKKV